MKMLLATAVMVLSLGANAEVIKQTVTGDAPAAPNWVPMTTVCYIGDTAMDSKIACQDDAEIVNLLSTNRVMMNSSCLIADKYCPKGSQFMLVTNIFARH